MKLFISSDYREMSVIAARAVARQVLMKPDSVLGLATGETTKGMYEKLVTMHDQQLVDFSAVRTFNLDEYYPIEPKDERSFHYYMKHRFFDQVNLKPENRFLPDGSTENPKEECRKYESSLAQAGGIDLQLLGIGSNGHIGFNEPGVDWGTTTRLVNLENQTVKKTFGSDSSAPTKAITMGIKNIMNASQVVLLASGGQKAEIVEKALTRPVTNEVPASILQLHPDLKIILDEAAAGRLPKKEV
ncbi:glucosamine-6-phosphate deaminase [Candidatus Bipolaricaulota bacterium]|nr:glucosamine-6-phosphate deaminase [Candidatus Bipolaricaulota bacterium]